MNRQEQEALESLAKVAQELTRAQQKCEEAGFGPMVLDEAAEARKAVNRAIAVIEGRV